MARFGNANAHRITARLVLVSALVALVLRPGAPAGAAAQTNLGSRSTPAAFSAPHETPGDVAPLEPLPRPTKDGRVPDAPTAAGTHAANGSGTTAAPTTTTAKATATATSTATSTATTTASPTPTAKKTTAPTWAPKGSSNLGTAQGALFNTSCSAPGQCTAVGRYVDTAGIIQPLAERLSGSTWKIDTMAAPVGSIGV